MYEIASDLTDSTLPAGAEVRAKVAVAWSAGDAREFLKWRLTDFLPIPGRNASPGKSCLELGCGSRVLTQALRHLGFLYSLRCTLLGQAK